jgi:stage II sporulation protein AA (anti-sigma F factor antagonist)
VYVGEAVDGERVVWVAGELDIATAGLMGDGLSLASVMPGDRLVVDVSRLTFMDVAGLGVLVATHERLVSAGGAGLVVRGASGIVRRLFELTGLSVLLQDRERRGSGSGVAADGGSDALEFARREAGLSVADLFVAYFALGGAADRGQLVAYLNGDAEVLDRHQRDIAVHAVNERLGDVGRTEHLLSYASA